MADTPNRIVWGSPLLYGLKVLGSRRLVQVRHGIPLLVLILALCLETNSGTGQRAGGGAQEDSYEAEGVWSDACPCRVPCPCWATRRANSKRCVNLQVFHIERGHFEGFDLTGSTFVLVGLPQDDYGTPDADKVYSDQRFSRVPAADLFSKVFGLPPFRSAEIVPSIESKISNSAHFVRLSGLLTYEVGPLDSSASEPLSTDVEAFLYPWLRSPKQWRARRVEYRIGTEIVTYTGTNSLTGEFRIVSPEIASTGVTHPSLADTNTLDSGLIEHELGSTCNGRSKTLERTKGSPFPVDVR